MDEVLSANEQIQDMDTSLPSSSIMFLPSEVPHELPVQSIQDKSHDKGNNGITT